MKYGRLLALVLCLCFLPTLWTGCSDRANPSDSSEDGIQILCTTFPHYDWMRQIIGETEGVTLSLLISNGTDPHSYEPTVADLAALAHTDAVILVGGESDTWIREAIAVSENHRLRTLLLSEAEGVVLREVTAESGHEHGERKHDHHDGHDHEGFDEHLWLSLSNAMACVRAMTRLLTELDPVHASAYETNAEAYRKELSALDEAYAQAVAASPRRELLFTDRFPFVYLTEDYGLHVHAAFSGCTTDVDADFETVVRLAESVKEMQVSRLMVTDGSDRKLAEAVIRACEQEELSILELDSLQTITGQRIRSGETYLSVMTKNLSVLKAALS
ncbi:MAG: zinc ABC transporter substrate-binding protein [Clostridia bacterium]|nr:zinc ABC transporter substrate-binding protein [Clostridia bacterium]